MRNERSICKNWTHYYHNDDDTILLLSWFAFKCGCVRWQPTAYWHESSAGLQIRWRVQHARWWEVKWKHNHELHYHTHHTEFQFVYTYGNMHWLLLLLVLLMLTPRSVSTHTFIKWKLGTVVEGEIWSVIIHMHNERRSVPFAGVAISLSCDDDGEERSKMLNYTVRGTQKTIMLMSILASHLRARERETLCNTSNTVVLMFSQTTHKTSFSSFLQRLSSFSAAAPITTKLYCAPNEMYCCLMMKFCFDY